MKRNKKKILSLLMIMMISASTLLMPASKSKAEICFHPSTHTVPQQLLYTDSYIHYIDGTQIKCYVTTSVYAVYIVCDVCGGYLGTSTTTQTYHSVDHSL